MVGRMQPLSNRQSEAVFVSGDPAFVGQTPTGSFTLVNTCHALLIAELRTDLARARRLDDTLAVAEGFEPSKALALHAFEVWGRGWRQVRCDAAGRQLPHAGRR